MVKFRIIFFMIFAQGAISTTSLAEIPIPFRSRPLTQGELNVVRNVIANEVASYDADLSNELLERANHGLIRAMPAHALFYEPWKLAATTTKVLDKTVMNEKMLSLEAFRAYNEHACKDGFHWLCDVNRYAFNSGLNADSQATLYRIMLASILVHEHIHVQQSRRYWHIGGTLAQVFTPLYIAITHENAWELEAYTIQDDFLSHFEYAYEIKSSELESHALYALRAELRLQRTAYQSDGIIEQLPPFKPRRR